MIQRQIKIWCAVGASAVAGLTGGIPAFAEDQFPGGSVAQALDLIFHGEGGESGLGFTRMKPSFTVPALTGAQLQEVLKGNTLTRGGFFTVYFHPNGTVEGWHGFYPEVEFQRCPRENDPDDGLMLYDGKCVATDLKYTPFTAGASWSIKDGRVCMPKIEGEETGTACYYAALVLNHVVLFTQDGNMIGKGQDLSSGKEIDTIPSR